MSSPSSPPDASHRVHLPAPPPPDTPEGRVLVVGLVVGVAYALLLIADSTPLATSLWQFVAIPLLAGTIAVFSLAARMDAENGRAGAQELDLARTIAVREEAVQSPNPDSALGRIMKEYLRSSARARCAIRSHSYAAGPMLWGTLLALAAAVFWGIGSATGTTWLGYLAIVVELPALVLLVMGVTILGTSVGTNQRIDGFDRLCPRRWRRFDLRPPAIVEAIQTYGWLAEFDRSVWRDAGLGLEPRSGPV